jgi:hypothetical protein
MYQRKITFSCTFSQQLANFSYLLWLALVPWTGLAMLFNCPFPASLFEQNAKGRNSVNWNFIIRIDSTTGMALSTAWDLQ